MKAIRAHRFGGSDVLSLDEIDDPVAGPGEIVIAVRAAGVNPADTYMRNGGYRYVPTLPFIPGGDAAGDVIAIGNGVTSCKVGERVFVASTLGVSVDFGGGFTGCYAQKVKRAQQFVLPMPDALSYKQAAAIGLPYVTAHFCLFERGDATAGETVFIHGASGAVGTAAIELAKRAGLSVIGSAGTDAGLDLVRAKGADHAVNHTQTGYLDQVRSLTSGQGGPPLILEMLADVNLSDDLDLIASKGRVIIVGCRGETTFNPRILMRQDADIRGVMIWNAETDVLRDVIGDILSGVAEGKLSPVVARTFPLGDAAEAQEAVLQNGTGGNIVLIP